MSVNVAIVGSGPALIEGWLVALQHVGFRTSSPRDLRAWIGSARRRAILLLAGTRDGLDVVVDIRSASTNAVVVVLLPTPSDEDHVAALRSGASGVGAWDIPVSEVKGMLDAGLQGRCTLPFGLAARLAEGPLESRARQLDLDDLDRELLIGLVSGQPTRELAERIGYSQRETFRRLTRLYRHIGVADRTQAVVKAATWRLIP